MNYKATILVIGSKGFIGSNICKYLQKKEINFIGVHREDCDLLNRIQTQNIFKRYRGKHVKIIFCASVVRRKDDSLDSKKKNIDMMKNFISAVKYLNISSFVYLSSIDVYKTTDSLLDESFPLESSSHYGNSKIKCENILQQNFGNENLCILRLPGIYGPNDKSQSVVGKLINLINEDKEISLTGKGNQLRDYLYVEDLSAIILKIILASTAGVFNLSSGNSTSINKIIKLISNYFEKKYSIKYLDNDSKELNLHISNRKFLDHFPEFKFTSIEEGIKKLSVQ